MTEEQLAVELQALRGSITTLTEVVQFRLDLADKERAAHRKRLDDAERHGEKLDRDVIELNVQHDQHERDHDAAEKLAAMRSTIALTWGGAAKLGSLLLASATGGASIVFGLMRLLGGS